MEQTGICKVSNCLVSQADASFGQSITLSSDGDTIAIGAPANWDAGLPYDSEPVRVFRWNGSEWLQFGNDILQEAANDRSGFSVSLSGAGDSLAIGAIGNNGSFPGAGHTRIYGLADTGNSRSFETETVSVEVMSINDAPTFNAIADRVFSKIRKLRPSTSPVLRQVVVRTNRCR